MGSGAIGGVVNVVTKRPSGEPETAASFEGGSFGTWRGMRAAGVPGRAE